VKDAARALGQTAVYVKKATSLARKRRGTGKTSAVLSEKYDSQNVSGTLRTSSVIQDALVKWFIHPSKTFVRSGARRGTRNLPMTLTRLMFSLYAEYPGILRSLSTANPLDPTLHQRTNAKRTKLQQDVIDAAALADKTGFSDNVEIEQRFKLISSIHELDLRNKRFVQTGVAHPPLMKSFCESCHLQRRHC
jgi:hypothetical protein